MSAYSIPQADPGYWTQSSQFSPLIYEGPSNEYNSDYSYEQAPRQWHFYEQQQQQQSFGNNNYLGSGQTTPPFLSHPTQFAPSNPLRALSTSTIASLRSPYTASGPHYNNTNFEQSYFDNSQEVYLPQTHFYRQYHHPTPSHTPSSHDWQMAAERSSSRTRAGADTEPAQAAHKALRPLLTGHSSSTGDFAPDVPASPRGTSQEEEQAATTTATRRVPNFDRTMSDIYQDELYNPNAGPVAPAPSKRNASTQLSPYRTVIADRLNASQEQRNATATSPQSATRATSPFRTGSPFATTTATALHGYGPIGTAAAARQQQKAEADAIAYQQHHPMADNKPSQTISPKDAVIEYHEEKDYDGPPLFPQSSNVSESSTFDPNTPMYGPINTAKGAKQAPSNNNNFAMPSVPASATVGNDNYTRYVPPSSSFRPVNNQSTASSQDAQQNNPQDYPAHLVSMETSRSEASDSPTYDDRTKQEYGTMKKPANTLANTGAFSCPYNGCTKRFESGQLLQEHKRDGHRSAAQQAVAAAAKAPSTSRRSSASDSASPTPVSDGTTRDNGTQSPGAAARGLSTGTGPHRCDRINPSTGKPCGTVFSRPYDLTRHEDTIHAQKTKVRCNYCTEEKTFSRNDALTRHMRVVHPNVEFAGKQKTRKGAPLEG